MSAPAAPWTFLESAVRAEPAYALDMVRHAAFGAIREGSQAGLTMSLDAARSIGLRPHVLRDNAGDTLAHAAVDCPGDATRAGALTQIVLEAGASAMRGDIAACYAGLRDRAGRTVVERAHERARRSGWGANAPASVLARRHADTRPEPAVFAANDPDDATRALGRVAVRITAHPSPKRGWAQGVEEVKALLARGAHPDGRTTQSPGASPLVTLANAGVADGVRMLLRHGADPSGVHEPSVLRTPEGRSIMTLLRAARSTGRCAIPTPAGDGTDPTLGRALEQSVAGTAHRAREPLAAILKRALARGADPNQIRQLGPSTGADERGTLARPWRVGTTVLEACAGAGDAAALARALEGGARVYAQAGRRTSARASEGVREVIEACEIAGPQSEALAHQGARARSAEQGGAFAWIEQGGARARAGQRGRER